MRTLLRVSDEPGAQSLQGAVTSLDSTASNFLPSRIQLQNAGTLYQYTCCTQDAPKYTARLYPKMSGVASGPSSSFLYYLHRSKMVALKTEMKSSPCFLEISSVLLLRSGQGGGVPDLSAGLPLWRIKSEATPQTYTKVFISMANYTVLLFFFPSPICYCCYTCLLTHLLPPSKALRKGSPGEATSKVCSNDMCCFLRTGYVWDTGLSIFFHLIIVTL